MALMEGIWPTITVAVGAFIGTDIDDMVVLTALFLSFRTEGRPFPRQIVLGQYLGFLTLIAISLSVAFGLAVVPDRWVTLLGIVPLSLGIRGLLKARHGPEAGPQIAFSPLAIAAVTISNGGDNISLYTPLFREADATGKALTVVSFLVMLGLWCALGAVLGSRKPIVTAFRRLGHILVPAVYVIIGMVLLVETAVRLL